MLDGSIRVINLNLDVTEVESGSLLHKLEITFGLRSRFHMLKIWIWTLKGEWDNPSLLYHAPDGTMLLSVGYAFQIMQD